MPDIQENYNNIKNLWVLLRLHELEDEFYIVCDLKLCNVIVGVMAHGSSHPCCWCDARKDDLSHCGSERTAEGIENDFWKYFADGQNKSHAKTFKNVVHPSILSFRSKTDTVLSRIPPPELHLLTGCVKTMFDALEAQHSTAAEAWLKKAGVEKEPQQGGCFTGNSARKLLKSADHLQSTMVIAVMPFVKAFRSLNEVVDSCFGNDLDPTIKDKMQRFQEDYDNLEIHYTPKVHALIHHVPQFCFSVNSGLGPYSEQASESLHRDFDSMWAKYKVRDFSCERYGSQFLKAICAYNSRHL